MAKELPPAYDPKQVEEKIYRLWQDSDFFAPEAHQPRADNPNSRESYSIILPPPNITGSLHLGHALNASISDILIRYHRMRGYKTVWFSGTDHAGIATQNVVEKELKKQGLSRWDLGRDKFIEKVWEWKNKYGNIIIEQLKKIGASCDWSRLRFTMDSDYSEAVEKAFVHYYKKGLIYRGKRVVNWCPRCQTSLSDLEIEYKEEKTKLWYIRYPLANSKFQIPNYIIVATTRPETMLGDAAVAVNPKDQRYKSFVGKKVLLPIQNREIPVIADAAVDKDFGTGAVKVTPAHDLTDAEIAERHKLSFYQVINERGQMTAEAGKDFESLKVEEAREKIVAELDKLGLVKKVEDYEHNLAVCYRCNATLEPLLSDQWFLKMADLAKGALKAVKSGAIKIIPKNFEKPYFSWLKNIKDWCISRQIWWGHQLPVFFCRKKQGEIPNFIVSLEKPKKCSICKNCEMEQSQDVLDTWFSSALWPFAALSKKDLKEFYPSDVLITAREIINLWVARMIFSGLEFMKEKPFSDVLIHATVLTREGKRMSKSLGTGVDPLELIQKYGADALRFGLIWQLMGSQDIHWDETAVMAGKKFANKLWNIARFILMNKPPSSPRESEFKEDKEILIKLGKLTKEVESGIKSYKFGTALRKIYNFLWHEFADKYIELSKNRKDEAAKQILSQILISSLKLLHPFMPFITEEIYQQLPFKKKEFLMIEAWS